MSIADAAVLVKLTIRQWDGFRKDKKISQFVDSEFQTNGEAGNYNTRLVDKATLKPVSKITSKTRVEHNKLTFPWCHDGLSVLPNKMYFKYGEMFRMYKDLFEQNVDNLCDQFPVIMANQQNRLGNLFDESLYPSVRELREKYSMTFNIFPIPQDSHFLIDLEEEEMTKVKNTMQEEIGLAQQAALETLYGRVHKVVQHMQARLADPNNFFKNSLVTNIEELVASLPALNMFDDPLIDKVHQELRTKLVNIDPNDLRKDLDYRKQVAQDAADIVSMLGMSAATPEPEPEPVAKPETQVFNPEGFAVHETPETTEATEEPEQHDYTTPHFLSDIFGFDNKNANS